MHGRFDPHCEAAVHCAPTGALQTPSVHVTPSALPQQSASVEHAEPLVQIVQHCMYVVVLSIQLVQGRPPPHWVDVVHVAPAAKVPQTPELQVRPEQQSVSVEQAALAALQHVPPVHELPLQQSVAVAQAVPVAEHVWHEPSLQMFEQQSEASVQMLPSSEQLSHEPL